MRTRRRRARVRGRYDPIVIVFNLHRQAIIIPWQAFKTR